MVFHHRRRLCSQYLGAFSKKFYCLPYLFRRSRHRKLRDNLYLAPSIFLWWKELKHNSNKMILIMGQLHIGVLKGLFEHNPNYKIVDISEYLN